MKVVENENQVDKYGRNYIKFTGVKNLQEIGNEYWVYFLDDLAEELLIYSGYNKTIENGKVIYRR